MKYTDFLRKLEAVIALSSALNYEDQGEVPTGVVGITFANSEIAKTGLLR
jgi:hypothetical protein